MSHKIVITIETGNASFEDGHEGNEIHKILQEAAFRIGRLGVARADGIPLLDSNGNMVGEVKVTKL